MLAALPVTLIGWSQPDNLVRCRADPHYGGGLFSQATTEAWLFETCVRSLLRTMKGICALHGN